jgi:hypothetical protein
MDAENYELGAAKRYSAVTKMLPVVTNSTVGTQKVISNKTIVLV